MKIFKTKFYKRCTYYKIFRKYKTIRCPYHHEAYDSICVENGVVCPIMRTARYYARLRYVENLIQIQSKK